MTDPAQQTTPVRTSATHPLEISTGDVVRQDTGDTLTLGITLMPGLVAEGFHGSDWDRDLAADIDAVRAWAPDIVLVIEEPGHEDTVDTLASELGEGMVHTIDTDAWPVPKDPDIRSERREILCNVLSLVTDRAGSRVLIISDRGAQEAVTLAAEFLMIAGVYTDNAWRMIETIRPGHFDTGAQSGYLGAMPEERWGGDLGLPLNGGLLAALWGNASPIAHGVLRRDGFHLLDLVALKDEAPLKNRIERIGAAHLAGQPAETADLVDGDACDIARTLRFATGGVSSLEGLNVLLDGTSRRVQGCSRLTDSCAWDLGQMKVLYIYGRISEATYRAIPQGAAA